jgi:raffinose/stachyose/melibiose transport system substrate-binding protein
MKHIQLSRRAFLQAASLTITGMGFVACAPAVAPAPSGAPQTAGGKIAYWGWPTQMTRSFDKDGQDKLVDRVKEETGIDLEVSLVEQNELGAKLKAALPANTGPDLLATDFDVMGPYWQFMEVLDGYAEAAWDPNWRDKFSAAALSEMALVAKIAKQPDKAIYLPGNMQLLGWPYYWVKDFEDNGIDAAGFKTFADFEAACDKLKAAGRTPIAGGSHPAGLVDWYQSLVEVAAPGQMEKAQVGKAHFTDPDMTDTFGLIAKVHNEYMQEGAIGADLGVVFPAFHKGEMAMSMQFSGTPWFGFLNVEDAQTRENMRGAYGTFQLPGSKGLAATDAGVALVAASQNKEAAWKVLQWLTTGKGAEYHAQDAGQPMGFKAITPASTNSDFDKNLGQPLYDALVNGDNKFRRVLCVHVYNALTKVIPGVVTGQINADQAAAEVQDAFDKNCEMWMEA